MSYKYIFKYIVVGECNVGKTSIIKRFAGHSFEEKHIATLGIDMANQVLDINNDKINMRYLGALRTVMVITFVTFTICTLAIMGIPPFSGFIGKVALIDGAPARLLVNFHSAFSLAAALIFLPLIDPLSKLCVRLVPARPQADDPGKARHLDANVLDTPAEVIIFDPPRNRFVILDSTRKVKMELTTYQVDAFCQRIRAEALTTNDPLAQFLAAPSFDESYDDSTGELTLTNPWMTYKVKTVAPQSAEMAKQYFTYVQWQTKLNTALRVGALPPFARLALNTALEQLNRIPVEVQVYDGNGDRLR